MIDTVKGELRYYAVVLSDEFDTLEVVPTGDAHYGNHLFSKSHFLRHIQKIKDTPNRFTILNGDLCESSLRSSKGDIYKQVGSPQDQRDWILEQLYPIKDKILSMVTGNHENRIYNECGMDISRDIAKELHIPYRPEGLLLKISFGSGAARNTGQRFVFWSYQTHGYGGARTKSAKATKVERTATWVHADCYIMSHDHVVNVAPDVYLIPDRRTYSENGFLTGKITAHRKMLVKSNAFLKWGGYSEMGGFPPVDLECPIIKLKHRQGRPFIKVEV